MRPFRSLSARLTVQFALLFAVAMLGVSAALSTFIAGAASREVESQLQSSGAVYDRLWQQRAHELQNAAQLLARDFGFRAAVATGDQATIQSALGNAAARLQGPDRFHRQRGRQGLGIDPAFPRRSRGLWEPLDDGRLTGVAVLAGRPRQLVAAPIMAPTLIGWVVFAADLDSRPDERPAAEPHTRQGAAGARPRRRLGLREPDRPRPPEHRPPPRRPDRLRIAPPAQRRASRALDPLRSRNLVAAAQHEPVARVE